MDGMEAAGVSTSGALVNGKGPPSDVDGGTDADDSVVEDTQAEVREPFVLAAVYDDDVEHEWKNLAYDMYAETVGQDEFNERIKTEFQEATSGSSGSLMSELGLKMTKTKLSLFYNSGTLSPEGKARMPRAVGGAGFITVTHKLTLPDHDFFKKGRCFRARLRHANLTFRDDAMLDGRVVCLKFCDEDQGGPLDFIFHTGRVSQYYNGKSFQSYLTALLAGTDSLKDWCMKQPNHYYGRVETVRREPKSFYDQRYYSHVTYEFVGEDKVKRLSRLRLLPADGCEETGLPSPNDQKQIWCAERRQVAENERYIASGYLRGEFYERMLLAPLQYRLQMQLRDVPAEDDGSVLNPCLSWDRDLYPWTDLAMITIALPMSEEVVAKTKYNLENHPPSFSLPACHSVEDFTSLPYIIAGFHGSLEDGYTPDDVDKNFFTKYIINVTTGNVIKAGTDADVYITLMGAKGRTWAISLDNKFVDDFEAGQTDKFEILATPVGEIISVQVELRSVISGREWYLEVVTVTEEPNTTEWRFPCYRWLITGRQTAVLLRRAEAILVHQEHSIYSLLQRKYELDERQKMYQWEKRPGLPSRLLVSNYNNLPKEAKLNQEKVEDLRGKYVRTLANTGVGAVKSLFEGWDAIADYDKMLTSLLKDKKVVRKVAALWAEDGEFGRQCLNGVHPTHIRRISELPGDLLVSNDHVLGSLDRGLSLEQELQAGHIFLLSFNELASIREEFQAANKPNRHLVVPYCLLYVRKRGDLVPIAIQLQVKAEDTPTVWTPQDTESDWLYAKMWVRQAEAQVHQIISRHLKTHLVMEAVCVATQRHLPAVHPVYKLLVPHLRYTLAVNVLNRQVLDSADDSLFVKYLATGAHHQQLMTAAYKTFSLEELHVPNDLKARGVEDCSVLKNYYYRDDALELWKILQKFMRTMLMLHYWTPENVRNDDEVQNWVADLHDNGLPCYTDHVDHGVPESFKTLEALIEFVTTVIFTASCHNAALTGGMMDYYGFSPNMPTVMYAPPAQERGVIDRNLLMEALPSRTKTAEVISAVYTLSRFSKDELFLGEFPQGHFTGETNMLAIEAFQEELRLLTDKIAERNEKLDIPYRYLSPDRIPNSIAN